MLLYYTTHNRLLIIKNEYQLSIINSHISRRPVFNVIAIYWIMDYIKHTCLCALLILWTHSSTSYPCIPPTTTYRRCERSSPPLPSPFPSPHPCTAWSLKHQITPLNIHYPDNIPSYLALSPMYFWLSLSHTPLPHSPPLPPPPPPPINVPSLWA